MSKEIFYLGYTCNVSPNSIVIIGIAAPPPKAKIKPNRMRKASKGVENLN